MAPLYHVTDIQGFRGIVDENTLATTDGGSSIARTLSPVRVGKPTVFFTRDFNHAKWFGNAKTHNFIIFQVDQQKLNTRYKLTPIHNWNKRYYAGASGNIKGELRRDPRKDGVEFEEVADKPIKNFLSYVTTIHARPSKETVSSVVGKAVMEKLNSYNIDWKAIS